MNRYTLLKEFYDLTAHNLYCYSADSLMTRAKDGFEESWYKEKEKLEKEDPQVEIVEGTDDVCKNCPHNMGGACENEDSVRQHDKRVYDKVIETVGNSAKWSSITKAIRENIIDSGKMRETCGKCQWSDICFKN